MLHLYQNWGLYMALFIGSALTIGFLLGVAFGCRTRRRRRMWPGKDDPPISHFRRTI